MTGKVIRCIHGSLSAPVMSLVMAVPLLLTSWRRPGWAFSEFGFVSVQGKGVYLAEFVWIPEREREGGGRYFIRSVRGVCEALHDTHATQTGTRPIQPQGPAAFRLSTLSPELNHGSWRVGTPVSSLLSGEGSSAMDTCACKGSRSGMRQLLRGAPLRFRCRIRTRYRVVV